MKINLAAFMIMLVGSMVLVGCVTDQAAQGGANPNPANYSRGQQGRFGILTQEQRQQLMQQAEAACTGKAGGDNCTMQTMQGNRNGACQTIKGNLLCRTQVFDLNRTKQNNS